MKKTIFLLMLSVLSFSLFSLESFVEEEIDLSKTMASDVSVIGGSISCQPVRTSYGYIATGDGKQLYGFTQEGRLLWQRSTRFKLKKFLSVFLEDLVCVVSTDSKISLINSTGLTLWTEECSFVVSDEPFQGCDGRIFVRGKNMVACYGIKGTLRWECKTSDQDQNIRPVLLGDGSFIVFHDKKKDGKSVGLRISPFGRIIEEIVFSGEVTDAVEMNTGIVLAFANGSAGLLSLKDDSTVSSWTIPTGPRGMAVPLRIVPDKICDEVYFVYGASSKVTRIQASNGTILSEFDSNVGGSDLSYCKVTAQGLVLCTKRNGVCLRNDGKTVWKVKFDPNKTTEYLFASDSGYLVLCNSNWSMELYQTRLNVGTKTSTYFKRKPKSVVFDHPQGLLPSSEAFGRLLEDKEADEMLSCFLEGRLENESEMLGLLDMEVKEMASQWRQINPRGMRESLFFKENTTYCEKLLDIVSETQILFCRSEIISMLKNTSDPTFLMILIRCTKKICWDPDSKILDTIEGLLNSKRISPKDTKLLNEIADATWEICRFMGRPVFFQKGKNILGYMLYPQFSKETRNKAIETMKKIADSNL